MQDAIKVVNVMELIVGQKIFNKKYSNVQMT